MNAISEDVMWSKNFLPDYSRVCGMAHVAEYRKFEYPARGIFMEEASLFDGRPFLQLFEGRFGLPPLRHVVSYFRQYRIGIAEKTLIHSDKGVADWSAVLSLPMEGRHNGAFRTWRHKATGQERPERDILRLHEDGMEPVLWESVSHFQMFPNECVLYRAELFHSRWPEEWTEDFPRTVAVFFFNEERKV